ncbi:MAG: Fic family protein [Candidatus Kerfeldbacteria bacterium]|nr:Fic family protein [Candidatus Kerfeldbacteria bacterium]
MFEPKYTITNKLLANVKKIGQLVSSLNERRFPQVVLFEMERIAREVSAHASTSIEGNPLPLTDVKRLLKQTPAHIRDTEREVLNYNEALLELKKQVDAGVQTLQEKQILSIHGMVTKELLPVSTSGALRTEPVFVNDPKTRQTIFWPPDHTDVPKLLNDLLEFVNTQHGTVDPLLLAGVFHKQFVLIHPFIDGNGRTVRLATKLLLAGLGLDTFHLFSFERYYNANVTKYFTIVGERGSYYDLKVDSTVWLEYFTDGIIDELIRVKTELEKSIAAPASGLKAHHRLILDYLREHGSMNDAIYATLVKRAKPTRALDWRYLLISGLIERQNQGKSTYYRLKQ